MVEPRRFRSGPLRSRILALRSLRPISQSLADLPTPPEPIHQLYGNLRSNLFAVSRVEHNNEVHVSFYELKRMAKRWEPFGNGKLVLDPDHHSVVIRFLTKPLRLYQVEDEKIVGVKRKGLNLSVPLLDLAKEYAHARGWKTILCEAADSRLVSHYAKLGFVEVGKRGNRVLLQLTV